MNINTKKVVPRQDKVPDSGVTSAQVRSLTTHVKMGRREKKLNSLHQHNKTPMRRGWHNLEGPLPGFMSLNGG